MQMIDNLETKQTQIYLVVMGTMWATDYGPLWALLIVSHDVTGFVQS